MSLLTVSNLQVSFGTTPVVRGVSFTLDKGEALALVGESGSGKSVTALSLLQLLPYPHASHASGSSIVFDGQELCGADQSLLQQMRGRRMAMIFQEPMTALNPLHTIEKQIAEVLWLHQQMPAAVARPHVIALLQRVGIPQAAERLTAYPHELSGGQRQRVMIAMALAGNPDILIADEPTTALDVTIQAQILDLLQDVQRERGMALLLITHDLHIVKKLAQRVAVMQNGLIVEAAATEQLFNAPSHNYTRMLLAATPSGAPAPVPANAPVMLEAQNITVHFPIKKGLLRRTVDTVKAVQSISMQVRAGETLGVVGESGSGKSTLVQALLRLTASKGSVTVNGQNISTLKAKKLRALRRDLQIVFQDPFSALSPRLTVSDIILEGLRQHQPHLSASQQQECLHKIMQEVGLDPTSAARYPHEFSGGQRQRIAIARALILKPKVLVLDEPTSALDRSVQKQVLELLRTLQERYGLAYIFITHDLAVVRAVSHRIMVLQNGLVVEAGPTQTVLANPEQAYTKKLIQSALD